MSRMLRFFPFAEFILSATRFFASLRMTRREGLIRASAHALRVIEDEGFAMTGTSLVRSEFCIPLEGERI